jgi:hypothetical protein
MADPRALTSSSLGSVGSIGPGRIGHLQSDVQGLIRWLNRGPIEDRDGAIVAWCDRDLALSYPYPEICGYFLTAQASVSALADVNRGRVSRCAGYLAARIRAGQLESRALEPGVSYNFDLSMIATGLLRTHMVFGEDVAEQGLVLAGLLRDQILDGGQLPAWRRGAAAPTRAAAWSTLGSLHLVKSVQCLLLADRLGLAGARAAADALVAATLAHHPDGRAPTTCPGLPRVHLHPVLYAVEGLWIYHQATGSPRALGTATELFLYAANHLRSKGRLPGSVDDGDATAGSAEQADALAQLLRAAVLLDDAGIADLAQRRLAGHMRDVEGAGTAVEYVLGSGHLNTWATIFSMQALLLRGLGRAALTWEDIA